LKNAKEFLAGEGRLLDDRVVRVDLELPDHQIQGVDAVVSVLRVAGAGDPLADRNYDLAARLVLENKGAHALLFEQEELQLHGRRELLLMGELVLFDYCLLLLLL